ncbi:hypothetical protein OS493_022965 [Desmophyllum pertusum]|uniref:Uncharacterized protein n=1 Tax=Desmophyllum pertusum TaxID=174260 RepID=A0A9X0CWS5_9CNID|nr:hypothetical protein OS493_022965 [Desmophyllum pertusum]
MNVTKCGFTNAFSASEGGAVYINALKASVQLRHTTFTNCSVLALGGGGGVLIVAAGFTSPNRKSGNNLVLVVESCRFIDCRTGLESDGGSLKLVYKTKIEISINNSHMISSYAGKGGALSIIEYNIENTDEPSHITIENSTFSNNRAVQAGGAICLIVNNQSSLILLNVIMESNSVKGLTTSKNFTGGAIAIEGSIFALRVFNSRFLNNMVASNGEVPAGGGALYTYDVHILEVKDSHFDGNYAGNFTSLGPGDYFIAGGGALQITCQEISTSIIIINTTFKNCSAALVGGAISLYLIQGGNVSLVIKRSLFMDNYSFLDAGNGGAISLVIHDYDINGVSPSRAYNSQLSFEDTTFERNAGYIAGSFIHAESSELLKVFNTTMDVRAYGTTTPMMLVTNCGTVDIANDNVTKFYCPVGSQIRIIKFTTSTQWSDIPKSKVTLEFSCSACTGNSYSRQRGRALGSQLVPGFHCLSCPFGANCTQNIVSKLNFWGFQEQDNPPTLRFIMCPVGYCSPPRIANVPEYNGCEGNRSGELCGLCNEGYTETLYSTHCRPSHQCNDNWFWPLAVLYVSLMALYFTFKPPIVPWIKRQILWFKKHEPANQDDNFDKGYLKILFYFYQAANLLLVSISSQSLIKTYLIVGLFNFKLSSGRLICPFPGLTVATKQLFSVSHVFGTMLMISPFIVFFGEFKSSEVKEPHLLVLMLEESCKPRC